MRTARHRSPTTTALGTAIAAPATVVAIAAILSTIAPAPCHAGPNAYGTLILHQNPALQGSCSGTLNGLSGIERCDDAITRVDDPSRCAVVFVLASFPGWATPSLRSVSFGLEYDQAEFTLSNLSSTADLEFSTDGWPAPGSGTSVVWTVPQERHLAEVYAFSAMFYGDGPARVTLSAHPTGAALFGDGNGLTDPISALGALGWSEPGFLPCPREVGACCWVEGECRVTNPFDCESSGGHFIGEDIQCAPDVCGIDTGACCFSTGNCEVLPRTTCEEQDGIFQGMDVPCTSYPCFDLTGCGPTVASRPLREGAQNAAGEIGRRAVGRRHDDPQGDPPCGELLLHTDGTFENGYIWQYGGIVPPYFGAFAECFEGNYLVCNAVIELTQIGFGESAYTDLYLWDDDGGCPGAVQCVRPRVLPSGIAFWPSVSQHRFAMPQCCMSGRWWIGYWPDWQGGGGAFYVGADLDGPTPGCPKNCIAPGLGYPSGWQSVSVVWGPTVAIGIGAEVLPCGPVPVERTSWGKIKALYGPGR